MDVVYLDQFLVTNIAVNYILLYATKRVLHISASRPRMLLGSVLGALYAAMMLLPGTRLLFGVTGKLLCSMLVVAVAYRRQSAKGYLRTLAAFYAASFVLGGCGFALTNAMRKNGISGTLVGVLIGASVIAYVVITVVSSYYKRWNIVANSLVDVTVELNGKTAVLEGLIDTGNSLCEPLSGTPVIVADAKRLGCLLPDGVQISENVEQTVQSLKEGGASKRLRFLPFFTVGTSHSCLIGLRPDAVYLCGRPIEAIIALSPRPVSSDETYHALVHPQLATPSGAFAAKAM